MKQILFPKKTDYPNQLKILKQKDSSNSYRELIESSASAYFETNFLTRYFFQKRFELAWKLLNKARTKPEILDAGCGIGFFLPMLSKAAKKVWAIDYAPCSLQYAKFMCQKRKINNVSFKQASLTKKLPFPAKKFDIIICLSVLEHIKDLEKTLNNFVKVLKDDGFLIAGYPNEDNLVFRVVQYLEKRILRPKVFATFQGTKLIHVSKAHQISRALVKSFTMEETNPISLLPRISFYLLQKCRKRK